MTVMHEKQSILDTVDDQVSSWYQVPAEVQLTCGYGKPFTWTLYQFEPRTNDLLGQYQYVQNEKSGRMERLHKYAPPFGLKNFDATSDQRFHDHLNEIMERRYLDGLGWKFYEEERFADPKEFQAVLLTLMCYLYNKLPPTEARGTSKSQVSQRPKARRMHTYVLTHC
jgi:hypothetical protein